MKKTATKYLHLFYLLSVDELAIIIGFDPSFELPRFSVNNRERMLQAVAQAFMACSNEVGMKVPEYCQKGVA